MHRALQCLQVTSRMHRTGGMPPEPQQSARGSLNASYTAVVQRPQTQDVSRGMDYTLLKFVETRRFHPPPPLHRVVGETPYARTPLPATQGFHAITTAALKSVWR
jgi:hypothetical protein